MPGFNSYDSIINALSVLNTGQEVFFQRTLPAAHVAGQFFTSWANTGVPVAGGWVGTGAGTPTMANVDSSTPGAIPLVSPTYASGTNPYIVTAGIMQAAGATGMAGTLMLVDRLADTGSLTTAIGTGAVTMPGGGWSRYNDGAGVMAFVEALTGVPTTGIIVQLSKYTNQAGTANRVSGLSTATAATLHRLYGTAGPFINLASGDTGISSIQEITISGANALNCAVVVCKPLFFVPCVTTGYYTERDLVIQTSKLPKLQVTSNDKTACLQWIFIPNAATTSGAVFVGTVSTVTG